LTRATSSRQGSILVEFGMVAFILYLLMVVILDLGRGSLATQTIQSAADLMAQEMARAPIGATLDFEDALKEIYVTERIFDAQYLVIELGGSLQTQEEIDAHFATLPLVNQILRPLMFRDTLPLDPPVEVLRYPGAVLEESGVDGYTVMIPQVESRNYGHSSYGVETIRLLPVVEEVLPSDDPTSHFPIDSGGPFAGIVNIRVNYPFQAAAMSAFNPDADLNGPDHIIVADDANVDSEDPPGDLEYAIGANQGSSSPYSGKFGLGHHYAYIKRVRPYRKLISVQAVARREVIFGPDQP
jgi:hypothetical protein